jgi:hypothetical protein
MRTTMCVTDKLFKCFCNHRNLEALFRVQLAFGHLEKTWQSSPLRRCVTRQLDELLLVLLSVP